MLEGLHAVIFDLDGTLMDSMWMWKDIDIEYLGRYGLCPPEGLDVIIEGMGLRRRQNILRNGLNSRIRLRR